MSSQETPDLCSRIFFHRTCDVTVGVECEACGVMPEHDGEGFDINSVLQCHGCEGVPMSGHKKRGFQLSARNRQNG